MGRTVWTKPVINPTAYTKSAINPTIWDTVQPTGALLLSGDRLLELSDGNTLGIYVQL